MNATSTDEYLASIPDWQKSNLQLFKEIIHKVSPNITEEIKWGVPVFIYNKKSVFAMGSFKAHTKYNFMLNGALLNDTHNLFNNGLESKKSRSIDLQEGEALDIAALEDLVQQALNLI